MRKFIIDTDTGSDDAVALMMALLTDDVEVVGITTVCGNAPLECSTKNALMTVEVCGKRVPVYEGLAKPIMREPVTAVNVHGNDGMGDLDLIHPSTLPQRMHAVDFMLETIRSNPDEIEIVAIGPVCNLAAAIIKDAATMKRVKRIWSMGTSGFGAGNTTPVAEFNVYADAESYAILLQSGIPITIIGFDHCLGPAALNKTDIEAWRSHSSVSRFAVECNTELLNYNLKRSGEYMIDLPDAVAMGVALWDDIVLDSVSAYCHCCTTEPHTYGQVIIYNKNDVLAIEQITPPDNATVIRSIDHALFKERMNALICG
ncbi:MAG: nucleoside hydrolase [Firmicutes bacterium HGW-Firmicutes-9]|nr:MAG: nucleoside hydrolase [Firmicutes bacterium HGW-Firmicutes-9]